MDSKVARKKDRRLGGLAWILVVGAAMSVGVGMAGTPVSASDMSNGGFCVRASSDGGEIESTAGRCDEKPSIKLDKFASWVTPIAEQPGMYEFGFILRADPDRFVRVYQDGVMVGGHRTAGVNSQTGIYQVIDDEFGSTKIEACYGDANDGAKRSGCVVVNLAELLNG